MPSPIEQVKEIWNRLPTSGKIATVASAFATLGLVAAIVFYSSQAEYSVLFSDLKAEEAQGIVEKIKAANVPYTLSNNGTSVLVPSEKVSELRLQIAAAGLLSSSHVGFDIFDKTNFGTTDFAQQVNYRRAIEGELAKTLEGMDELEQARVHITPKKESVFSEKEEGAKASVMLKVKQGKQLSDERTDAIVSLVASAVESLDPSNVTVTDSRGRLLTSGGRGKNGGFNDAGAFHAQLEAKQKFEMESAARIIALLEPVVGENKVRADVSADVDFSQVEQTEEKYNPQSQVVRSQQNTQEARNSGPANLNQTAGARANNPTTTANANSNTATQTVNNTATSSSDNRATTTTNYEIDKTTKRTIGGGGRINRMTVSVVVDYKNSNGVDAARTPEEVQKLQELVSAAVGSDTNRGDSVVVQTMAFDKPPQEESPTATWLDKNKSLIPSLIKYGSLGLIAFLIFLFVIRPARKAWKSASATPELADGETKLLAEANAEQERRDEDAPNQLSEEMQNQIGEEAKNLLDEEIQSSIEGDDMSEIKPGMTVAQIEAKLESELNETPESLLRAEKIKNLVVKQTLDDPETVVSTLRGWLREVPE